jgi:hypothetical protein
MSSYRIYGIIGYPAIPGLRANPVLIWWSLGGCGRLRDRVFNVKPAALAEAATP